MARFYVKKKEHSINNNMKTLITLIFLFGSIATHAQFSNVFISNAELVERLDDPNLVVIHVDSPEGYATGHIPGAIYMSSQDFTVRRNNIVFEVPEPDEFAETLARFGIGEDSFIVIAPGWDVFEHAYRLYFTMDYFGLGNRTRMLDGGMRGWYKSGLSTDQDSVSTVAKKVMTLNPDPAKLADKDWVREHAADDGVKILDARIEAYYSGKSGNFKRGGHITNAGRVTWLDLVDENFFVKDEKELRKLFREGGAKDASTVATYCHIGLRASVLYTVAKSLGYDAKLYDGSMNEWEGLGDAYPVESAANNHK